MEKGKLLRILRNTNKKIKDSYSKNVWIIRLIIILLLALYVNTYIVPDLKTPSNNIPKTDMDNTTYLNLSSNYFDLTQEDLGSGNLNSLLWKIIYLGSGKDRICFEKTNLSNPSTFSATYNGGDVFNVSDKKCFNIPQNQEIVTFQVSYNFEIVIPNDIALSRRVVNKSECIWFTGEDTCITQEGIDNKKEIILYFNGEVYLEANWFHKLIKFLFIFFSTGAILWAFSRTFYLIKYGWEKRS